MSTRRRNFLGGAVGLPAFLTALAGGSAAAAVPKRDLLAELKVRPFINAAGTYTTHSGSLMRPEVMETINYASQYFVEVDELHDAVGKRIAELGMDVAVTSPDVFDAFVKSEMAKWGKVIREAKIQSPQ